MTTTREPRRANRAAGPPTQRRRALPQPRPTEPTICTCTPIPVAHYRNSDLIALYRRHWGSRNGQPGCGLPNEPIDPRTYTRSR